MNGWLRANITSILAIIYTCGFFAIEFLILLYPVRTDNNTTFSILATLSNTLAFVLGHYFGSSKTLSEKLRTEQPPTSGGNNSNP